MSENSIHGPQGLGDVDAVLAALVQAAEEDQPFSGAEAIAVRAIVAYSRCGRANQDKLAITQARALFLELVNLRGFEELFG